MLYEDITERIIESAIKVHTGLAQACWKAPIARVCVINLRSTVCISSTKSVYPFFTKVFAWKRGIESIFW